MNVTPPTSLWGLSITARPDASPVEIGSTAIALQCGQLARIRFLRWDLRDFAFAGDLSNFDANSWALTLVIDVADDTIHLWQGDGVFYTHDGQHRGHGESPEPDGAYPRWHNESSRLWPVIGATALPFRGQFHAAGFIGYVFGETENSTLSVLLCKDDEQDAEDHYASED